MKHRSKSMGGATARLGSKSLARALPVRFWGLGGGSGFLMFLSFCMLVVSALSPALVSGLRMRVAGAVAPVVEIVSLPFQNAALFIRNVSGLAEIQAENGRLIDENIKLREWYQTALLLEAENKSLHELLNVKIEQKSQYITARVLVDGRSAFAKSILVSAGTLDGVKKGQAVVSGEGLVGRVVEAGGNVSRILLITDMNSRVPVLIEDSRQHAIFSGNNGATGFLNHLPVDTEVKEGARVVTSGQGGIFPMGLPVGVVREIVDGMVKVEPFTDFSRMVYVRVIDQPEDPNLLEGTFRHDGAE